MPKNRRPRGGEQRQPIDAWLRERGIKATFFVAAVNAELPRGKSISQSGFSLIRYKKRTASMAVAAAISAATDGEVKLGDIYLSAANRARLSASSEVA